MQISTATLSRITGKAVNANMNSVVIALQEFGPAAGLDKPHRVAHFIAQLAHESAAFRYDREVWGPTPAQERYDIRVDLGNTPERDGDGKKNAGRGPIQLTGAYNIRRFHEWCIAQGYKPPDFPANPDLINSDPWEGLSAIWYWTIGNPTGKSLNRFADANDIETITKRINGGLNGFADRINWYVRTSLVLLGYGPDSVKAFQVDAQRQGLLPADQPGKASQVDGDPGPKTRAAMHMTLAKLSEAPTPAVKAAPVAVETEVAVVPKGAQNTLAQRAVGLVGVVAPAAGLFAGFNQTGIMIMVGLGILAVVVLLIRGEQIAARAKAVLKSFDEPVS